MYAALAGLPAWTLAPFQALQRVLHAAARTVLDLKPHDRVTPVLQQLLGIHVPVAERIQYKLCFLVHKLLLAATCELGSTTCTHAKAYLWLTDISCRCTCSCSIYTVCFVIVWRRRRAADTSTNRRHGFICRRTASMEQAADTAEAAAVDRYFSSPAKTFLFQSATPYTDTGNKLMVALLMRCRSPSSIYGMGGAQYK